MPNDQPQLKKADEEKRKRKPTPPPKAQEREKKDCSQENDKKPLKSGHENEKQDMPNDQPQLEKTDEQKRKRKTRFIPRPQPKPKVQKRKHPMQPKPTGTPKAQEKGKKDCTPNMSGDADASRTNGPNCNRQKESEVKKSNAATNFADFIGQGNPKFAFLKPNFEATDLRTKIGLPRDATEQQIRAQIAKLVIATHPDRNINRTEAANHWFSKVMECKETFNVLRSCGLL